MDEDNAAAEFVKRFPTVEAYMRHHQHSGHICCNCINQSPPMACCNSGHDEAMLLQAEFIALTAGLDKRDG